MANAFIPYGAYWSTPFAKWQGALANLNSIRLAAAVGSRFLESKRIPRERIDLGILGITNPQPGSFYGLQEIYTPAFLKECQGLLDEDTTRLLDHGLERGGTHALVEFLAEGLEIDLRKLSP